VFTCGELSPVELSRSAVPGRSLSAAVESADSSSSELVKPVAVLLCKQP